MNPINQLKPHDPGFIASRALAFDLSIIPRKFESPAALVQYEREVVRRLNDLPGVEATGLTTTVPLRDAWGGHARLAESADPRDDIAVDVDYVDGGYFRAMGIGLLRGRVFTENEQAPEAPPVAIINQRLADMLLPGQDPLGRRLRMNDRDWEIVGVVNDVRQRQLDAPPTPHVYRVHALSPYNTSVVVRSAVDPAALIGDIRRTMAQLDPDQSVANLRTLDHTVTKALEPRRLTLQLVGVFAAVALTLACLGIYGVMAYTISQRQREFGIRLALGALNRDVIALILKDGLRLVGIGLAVGVLGGFAITQVTASLLYEVSGTDPLVFVLVLALLTLVATIAIIIPALRVTRINALTVLRAQ